jgi:large subunit ribosomal protein L24
MAAKIKKGDKVVVLAGKDKGKHRQGVPGFPEGGRTACSCDGRQHGAAPHQADPGRPRGRHQEQGSAAPPVERRDRRPKDGKATRVGFKNAEDGQEGPLRQDVGRGHLMADTKYDSAPEEQYERPHPAA